MCGIAGIITHNEIGRIHQIHLSNAIQQITSRGPDDQGLFHEHHIGLGHRRLSVIDTSAEGRQPMFDEANQYGIIFNGEIYNYKQIRVELKQKGVHFRSESDTEVLLQALIQWGLEALNKLNGFFAFAFYNKLKKEVIIARDRIGIKPLYYYADEDKFAFASEIKALQAMQLDMSLDHAALFNFFQLNYSPSPQTLIKRVRKLKPGHWLKISPGTQPQIEKWYDIPFDKNNLGTENQYEAQKKKMLQLMEQSIQDRMVADVPLGSFLSGGIDSSVIATIASRHHPNLQTFSIGFADEPFFDETKYAKEVAKKINSQHTVFSLRNRDLHDVLEETLNYLDEPFADSSMLPLYMLCKKTRGHITVALSGDGADELFSGYNKHKAFYTAQHGGWKAEAVSILDPLWNILPQSRNFPLSNKFRQFSRFAKAYKMPLVERYWHWAIISNQQDVKKLIHQDHHHYLEDANQFKENWLAPLRYATDMQGVLMADMKMVLEGDMLVKVDRMSMANSLEVRVPFLDHRLVEFAFSLPESAKINQNMRKRIVQDAFRDILPPSLYQRPKHGFEVPLLKWFNGSLKEWIHEKVLWDKKITQQGILNPVQVKKILKQLNGNKPGDAVAKTWALITFQYWYDRNFKINN